MLNKATTDNTPTSWVSTLHSLHKFMLANLVKETRWRSILTNYYARRIDQLEGHRSHKELKEELTRLQIQLAVIDNAHTPYPRQYRTIRDTTQILETQTSICLTIINKYLQYDNWREDRQRIIHNLEVATQNLTRLQRLKVAPLIPYTTEKVLLDHITPTILQQQQNPNPKYLITVSPEQIHALTQTSYTLKEVPGTELLFNVHEKASDLIVIITTDGPPQ